MITQELEIGLYLNTGGDNLVLRILPYPRRVGENPGNEVEEVSGMHESTARDGSQ